MSRIKHQDLTPTCASPFMTTFAARVKEPLIDALVDPALFMDVRSNLRPGDQVAVCQFDHGDQNKALVIAYITLLITQRTPDGVEFVPISPMITVDEAKAAPAPVPPALPELEIRLAENGYVVVDAVTNHAHKHFKTESAAKRYVADYGGKAA